MLKLTEFHVVWTDFEDQNATAANTQELMVSNDRKLNEYLIKLTLVTACFTASIGSLALTAVDRYEWVLISIPIYLESPEKILSRPSHQCLVQ